MTNHDQPILPYSFPWSWEAAQAMLTDDVIGGLGADVAYLPRAASSASGSEGTQHVTLLGPGTGKGGNKNGKPIPSSTRKSHGSELFIMVDHTETFQLDSFLVSLIFVRMAKIQSSVSKEKGRNA